MHRVIKIVENPFYNVNDNKDTQVVEKAKSNLIMVCSF